MRTGKTGLSTHLWGCTLTGSLWEIFCGNGFCASGSWHTARSPTTNTLPGRSTGLILLTAAPIPPITWTGANKNKDKQNSPAEFVVQQGCLLVLCNNTRLYQADTVSIISVSLGKVTGQKACVFNGFRALAPYSHSVSSERRESACPDSGGGSFRGSAVS